MKAFLKSECYEQERLVQVSYLGLRDNKHRFRVSSLSRPGMSHIVHVQLAHKFNTIYDLDPEVMCKNGYVRIWSSDEWFLYGGCAYNATIQNYALYPEFKAPTMSEHDYGMSHTGYAVLDLIARMGPGELKDNYSAIGVWDDDRMRYTFEKC